MTSRIIPKDLALPLIEQFHKHLEYLEAKLSAMENPDTLEHRERLHTQIRELRADIQEHERKYNPH